MSEYFNQIAYGIKSFITGMKLTLNHFNNKKDLVATLQYPHEKWPVPERNIGFDHSDYNLIRSRLHVDIDDCISCMQCEKACPVDCIKIDSIKPSKDNAFDCGMTSNDTQKKMIVSRFTIDMSECMYCNLCVFPCPEECIYMVGGPNDKKHEIDYEFSQYKRDGMIFEFADATDDVIRDAGGEKWLVQRDARQNVMQEGIDLKGEVKIAESMEATAHVKIETLEVQPNQNEVINSRDVLEIISFNVIKDKMCRGIAKKSFTAAKRSGKDHVAILAEVSQALSDAGKLTEDIQTVLATLAPSKESIQTEKPADTVIIKTDERSAEILSTTVPEIEIKDLNSIEDKMARGTAKKAFTAAKRSGEDKVEAVRQALIDSGLMNKIIEDLLISFSSNVVSKSTIPIEDKIVLKTEVSETIASDIIDDLSLFEITELNGIEDKMARGIAKKIYTAGKRAGKFRIEVIGDIREALTKSDKLDDTAEKVLNDLKVKS